ncbi:MAG: PASTA domain-containing protein [Pyrinomonadaceae bacterium]
MLRNKPYLALTTGCLFAVTLIFLFAAQFFQPSVGAEVSARPAVLQQSSEPIALVKSILVSGTQKIDAALSEVKVTRASGGDEPGKSGMRLYTGDEVTTSPNAQLTMLFLDRVPEKDNEVLVDADTRVRIGSIFTWVGRILVRCKGAFATRTEKVKLGVQGTEYELIVQGDGTNRITVLEGQVSVEKEGLASLEDRTTTPWAGLPEVNLLPSFTRASFIPTEPPQKKLELVAIAGQTTTIQNTFTFPNRCAKGHQYEINGPRSLPWFQILGADRFEIGAGQSRSIVFAIQMDAQNLAVRNYEGDIVARCLDCSQDQSCDLAGLLLPVSVSVVTRPGSVNPGTQGGETKVSARRLQEVVLNRDGVLSPPSTAADERVGNAVKWSNEVILSGQPKYSAQSVIPHFRAWTSRQQEFRDARMNAIMRADARGYKIVGDVYADWGNGAKALDAYERAAPAYDQSSPDFAADLGEASRLAGNLDKAEEVIRRATASNRGSARALNALGNVYLDRAKVSRDKRDYVSARTYLERARVSYEAALQVSPDTATRHHGRSRAQVRASDRSAARSPQAGSPLGMVATVKAVSQSNIGEVYLEYAAIAKEQGRNEEAFSQYRLAESSFRSAADIDQQYPFAKKGLGNTYRGAGETALSQGDRTNAAQLFGKSQENYRQALRLHKGMAEAHVGLGNLLESAGQKSDAIKAYQQAAQLRPEQPDPHYYLAVALADTDKILAADYARTYQKLERQVFLQGQKAANAQRVAAGLPPLVTPTPMRTPTATPRETFTPPTPTPTPNVTPTPIVGGKPVTIPSMKGDKPESALAELRKKNLQGQLREQAECEATGRVLFTQPPSGEKVPPGTLVTVYVSAPGENRVTMPPLKGADQRVAKQQLDSIGLRANVKTRETDRSAPYTVIGQKPDPGRQIPSGCSVELTVAIPIPPVTVPTYIGRNIGQVYYTSDGLSLGNVVEVESRQPGGTVVDQSPRPGEVVPRGTRLNLVVVVSLVTVPNVSLCTDNDGSQYCQYSFEQAVRQLRAAGLDYEVVEGDSRNSESRVRNQSPEAGTRVRRGTKVRLWLRAPS